MVTDYHAAWPLQFAQVAGEVRSALPGSRFALEHIGSTAVPGLCAKPVLDIALGVSALDEVEAFIAPLAGIGFTYRPGYEAQIPDRRYFVRDAGRVPRVHLHAVVLDGTLWRQHLRFRDLLRQDPGTLQSYAALKRQLAAIHASDKAAYTDAKSPFIQHILALDAGRLQPSPVPAHMVLPLAAQDTAT